MVLWDWIFRLRSWYHLCLTEIFWRTEFFNQDIFCQYETKIFQQKILIPPLHIRKVFENAKSRKFHDPPSFSENPKIFTDEKKPSIFPMLSYMLQNVSDIMQATRIFFDTPFRKTKNSSKNPGWKCCMNFFTFP